MVKIVPVRSALRQGHTILKGRIGMVSGISTPMHLRNRTAIYFNRRFSRHFSNNNNPNGTNLKNAKNVVITSTNIKNNKKMLPMKWAILTGVTIGKNIDDVDNDLTHGHTATYKNVKIFNNNWMFFCYSTLPLNAISRLWGQVNSLTLPMWLRPVGFNFYTNLFGVNLNEMEDPDLYHYANLSEFFYRTIRPETRPIAQGDNILASPSDGQVLQIGIIDSETGEIEQVKGLTYSIKEFLGTHDHPMMTKSETNLTTIQEDNNNNKNKLQKLLKLNQSMDNLPKESTESLPELLNTDTSADSDSIDTKHVIKFKDEGDTSIVEKSEIDLSNTKKLKLLNELALNIPRYRSFNTDPSSNIKLYFAVIYLSPGDYHHYHSPVDWVCKLRRHFPGDLYSVAPFFQKNMPNLFIKNERVALLGYWKYGFFSMTPVGATNVGSIRLNFDEKLVTNVKRKNIKVEPHTCYEASYKNASSILGGIPLEKGEEMGGFKLGSTVVLCFEAPSDFKFNINVGDKVKMGQKLGQTNE
ncbi:phosphatidylserine decarboxylase 1 [Maudiozyma exigua]|uniref:Phosphatidylserine decarboxylase proenzyme 1, mitochondrial n=1 Tax=Maudiozyma exigua TaxID=34358 RepID=A0A9P6WB23_MAUEX|nr:phosphatidylserine decarboxylase 1 [Kazachstania exigua]